MTQPLFPLSCALLLGAALGAVVASTTRPPAATLVCPTAATCDCGGVVDSERAVSVATCEGAVRAFLAARCEEQRIDDWAEDHADYPQKPGEALP